MKLKTRMTPKQVHQEIGHLTNDNIPALIAAYDNGYTIVGTSLRTGRARITFSGDYAPCTDQFNAATALYSVRWVTA